MKLTEITKEYLDELKPSYAKKGYPVPKWIQFAEHMLESGWSVKLRRSKTTVSKYLYISKDNIKYKIRFSNHLANATQEHKEDSDFYVGVNRNGAIKTEELIQILDEGPSKTSKTA
jgi:hypothetical protein